MTEEHKMGRTARQRKTKKHVRNLHECLEHVELYRSLRELGWSNEAELRICEFEDTGKGLYSRKRVKSGDCIISLPFEALISLKSIEEDWTFRECFDETAVELLSKGELQFQSLLAYYLSHLCSREDTSRKPYLESLPKQFPAPYFCAKKELMFLPDSILRKIVAQNEIIKQNYGKLQSISREDTKATITLELFKWAYFVVNTRSVYLDSKYPKAYLRNEKCLFEDKLSDDPNMALAPFLDFFNHDSNAKTVSKLSIPYATFSKRMNKNQPIDLRYELKAQESYPPYSQIFISYGVHNNTKLLVEYGFFLSNNQHEFVELTLDDINAFIKYDPELRPLKIHREKYCFIADHNLDEQLFFVPGDLLSHNLSVCLTILFVEQNIHQLRTIAFGELPSLDPIRDLSRRLLEYKLREYQSFLSGLSTLPDLTPSGRTCRAYLNECIKFLNKIRAEL